MRIALIDVPYPLQEAPSPPLGLSYVAAVCEAAGSEVAIFDYVLSQYNPGKLQRDLDAFQPDVVGTTAVTMNFRRAEEIIREAKHHRPSLITMMGGPHVTFDFENALRDNPELDIVVLGEGEETVSELIPVITDRNAWHQIKGIAFMEEGQIHQTEPRPLIKDLDTLPLPSRHLIPLSRYQALGYAVTITTSRGCPNLCIFCLGRRMVGLKVRYRSATRIADEIEAILSYGLTRINVADDLFTANKERVRAVCNEIGRRGLKFGWSAWSRVNTVDKETLQIMRDAGCDSVGFGIESGNQEMLKRVKKGTTLEKARLAVRASKEVGLRVHASFIIGLPGETPESMQDSARFAEELQAEHGYHLLAPFPGTTVRENISEYDLQILTNDWNQYDANHAITRTSAVSAEDADAFVAEHNKRWLKQWDDAIQHRRDGQCTEAELMMLEGQSRTDLIYTILSGDVLEKVGCFSKNGCDPMTNLCDRIAAFTGHDREFVGRCVRSLETAGYLKCDVKGTRVEWYWRHNNATDRRPLTAR